MKMNMKKNKNIIIFVVAFICCVALAIFYATVYPGHLSWQEQNQIFLNTPHWLATYFDKPAWLGCMAGEWLTQFYYMPIVGAVILSLTIAVCTLCFAMFMLKLLPSIAAWILTAVFLLLMVACSMPSSSNLSFFICSAGGLLLGLFNIKIPLHNGNSLNLSPLLVIPAYWTFGFGALLTALSIILLAIRQKSKFWWVSLIVTSLFVLGTPAILSNHYALPYSKALLYPGLVTPSKPQMEFEKRVAIADAFYNRDYDKTKRLALKADPINDITAFYYYLASARQDSLPDNLLKYPVRKLGTLTTIGDTSPLPVINMMNDLYYELGDMTYAERAAMMRNVFSPHNRNVRMVQRLAEINLVSGDTLAAMKYLRILNKTHAYSNWSKRHTPTQFSPEVESEIIRRRAFSNDKDNIRLGDNCRNILLELLESNPRNTLALDYLLCTDLLLKDMDTFKMDYDTYCIAKGNPRYKDLYQQALMIYLAGTNAPEEEWERYIVSEQQMRLFNQYSNRRGNPAFRGTYWYYFDKQ